jgi:hypothetical protein
MDRNKLAAHQAQPKAHSKIPKPSQTLNNTAIDIPPGVNPLLTPDPGVDLGHNQLDEDDSNYGDSFSYDDDQGVNLLVGNVVEAAETIEIEQFPGAGI